MKYIILLLLVAPYSQNVFAQNSYYNSENKEKMKHHAEMVGDWEGAGWIINRETRQKEFFTQKEHIVYSMDSTIIIIDGLGKDGDDIIHDAHAVLSVNPQGNFYFTSFLGDGRSGKYDFVVEGEHMVWKIPTEQGNIRFTITNKDGLWTEVGEFEMNGQLYPFLEMKLKKIN